jgi:hypothetical protein
MPLPLRVPTVRPLIDPSPDEAPRRRPRIRIVGAASCAVAVLAGCASLPAPPSAKTTPGATTTAAAPAAAPAGPAAVGAPPAAPAASTPPASRPTSPAGATAPAGGPPAGATAATPPVPPGGLRPFADVIKDSRKLDGVFTLYQKDDKVWMELGPGDFNSPFIVSPKLKTGIGEGRLVGGLMDEEVVVEFRRIHNTVQLLARNLEYFARPGSPEQRSIDAAFSASLLGSVPVLSQPHPERKSVLIEANGLLMSDLLGLGMRLQRSFRQGYSFDGRNSAITSVRNTPELIVMEVLSHFYTGNIQVPQPPAPGQPPPPPQLIPTTPRALPDPRSLFLTIHYSIARLPAQPMRPRVADPRIGYFTSNLMDYSDDLARTPRVRNVMRWRLEKKDPTAEMSEPVKPITFWLDRTIPEKYRATVSAGVLEWNKAFEKIGFRNALRVEIQPNDAEWDTLDFGRASIRWMTSAAPTFGGIGPSHVDPRTGEILDADIILESLVSRNLRTLRSSTIGGGGLGTVHIGDAADELPPELAARGLRGRVQCNFAEAAAEQLAYALDVFEARGDLDPSSPEAEQFVHAYLKDVTMHEVGHTLGLRHNFRASRIWNESQLRDPDFVAQNGLTGSVMEYTAINLPEPGAAARLGQRAWSHAFTPTIGPYDMWAIEYGYRPLPADGEREALQRIAARSAEPQLAYATDEDNFLGIDPESLQFDLGADVIGFARKRVAIARDLLDRQETRSLRPDQDYSVLRRSVSYALRDMSRAGSILARQIGGVRTLRDFPGSGRDPLTPVPAAQQREALDVLATSFLSANSFKLSPELQRKLAVDFSERTDAVFRGEQTASTDFSLASLVLDLQRGVLNSLMSDTVATRLLDSEAKAPKDALPYSELLTKTQRAVWSELATGADIAPVRRELQRDHVNKLAALLLRPTSVTRADVRSLMRQEAQALLGRIEAASRRSDLSSQARAHLKDSADTLSQALTARLQRAGT